MNERIQFLNKTKDSLEKKNDEMFWEMNSVQQNLVDSKKDKSKEEIRWETEKSELFAEVVWTNEIMEQKEETAQQWFESLEKGYQTTLKVFDQRIQMLDEEKRLIEKELTTYIDHLQEKDKISNKEVTDLRNMSLFLVNTIEERE